MSERTARWSLVFDLVTMAAVLVGLTFGGLELRQLRSAQESQALMQFYGTYHTPLYIRGGSVLYVMPEGLDVDEIGAVMEGENETELTQLLYTFEGLGLMVFRGDVSIDVVDEMFRFNVTSGWRKLGPWIISEREKLGYSNNWEWFQWLAERLEERSGGEVPPPAYELYRDWKE